MTELLAGLPHHKGTSTDQMRTQVLTLLHHISELEERLDIIDIEERIIGTQRRTIEAAAICELPKDAFNHAVQDLRSTITRHEQEIERRLTAALGRSS